jgi:iron complex outermembrane receptor protein
MNLHPLRASARRSASPALSGLAFLLLASSVPLAAQTAAPAPAKEEVVVLSPFSVSADNSDRYHANDAISAVRVRAPLIDTASSISVLTRDMLDDIGPNRVFDATRYVAGVQEGRGIQFQDRMIIRGFETQGGARTVDNFLQSADSDNVVEAVIDRIEVTKGPNAILSPAGAPGGSLNIIMKSPTFKKQRSFNFQVGQFDAQKYVVDLSGPLGDSGKLAYRLIHSGQDSERYWDDSYIRNRTLAPMFAWRINEKTLLTVKVIGVEQWISREPLLILDPSVTATTNDPFLAPGINPQKNNGIQPWSHTETHSGDVFAALTTEINQNVSLRVAANGRYILEDHDQNFLSTSLGINRYNPYTGVLTQDATWALANSALAHNATTNPYVSTPSPFFNPGAIPNRGEIQWTRRKTGNFQTDVVGNYQFGNTSSQTVAGLGYSRQLADSHGKNGTMPNIDLSKPLTAAYATYPAALSFHNLSSYTNVQLYVNQRFGFLDNKLYLTGGLLRYSTKTTATNALTGAAPAILDDSKLLWNASVLYKVRDNVSLYYSHSINASPTIANNLPLWREGGQDEIGFKTEFFGQKLSFNAAYFEIAQTNVTVPNPARQTDPSAPQTLVSDLSNKGYEFEVMGRLTDSISLIGSWSHLKMRDSLGRMVRAVADNNATLLVNYRFTDGEAKGLAVNFGTVYNGRRAGDSPGNGTNLTPLNVATLSSFYVKPQYTTTLGFSYRWNEHYFTRLTIDNVFDEKNHIAVAGARFSGAGLTTMPGRNIRFSATINF